MAVEQGAHTPHQNPVLRDQRDRQLAALHVHEHLRGRALRFVFEAVAKGEGGAAVGCQLRERIVVGGVGVDHQSRHGGVVEQTCGERIGAAGTHGDPGGRGSRCEQAVGRRWRCKARPFERDTPEQPLARARPGHRRQQFSRGGPVSVAHAGRKRGGRANQLVRGHDQRRHRLIEAARIAPRPRRAPSLRAQQRGGTERIERRVEAHLPGLGRHRRSECGRHRLGGLDARQPAAGARECAARFRQQLCERQQHDAVAQRDALLGCPAADLRGDRGPAIPVAGCGFIGWPRYGCHRRGWARGWPGGPRK